MKIAEIVATFPPYHGGMGYCCFHNADQLSKLGHEVTVFTIDHGRSDYLSDPDHFKIVRLKTPLIFGDGAVLPQLMFQLKQFDIIHLHYPFFGGAEYIYLAACMLSGKKLVLTYHMDVYGDSFLKTTIINLYEAVFLKKIIQRADLISSPGNDYLKSTKAGRFINWSKVSGIVHGGVDIKRFKPGSKPDFLLNKHNLYGKKVILFVGNIQPFKGLNILIKSFSQIQNPDTRLLVVGGGYGESDSKNLVKKMNLSDKVIFAGPQSPDEFLPDYYRLGDFLVLPSTHSESFGLVVLEAMASGKPAIVSSLPGPSQLIDNNIDGLICNKGDVTDLRNKIESLINQPEKTQEMGLIARKKIEQVYSWTNVGLQLESAMKSLRNTK